MVVHVLGNWHGYGFKNLGKSKINFIFVEISFGMNVKGQGNPGHLREEKNIGKSIWQPRENIWNCFESIRVAFRED